jgi:hypothetical protein
MSDKTVNLGSEVLSSSGISKFYIFWIEINYQDGSKIELPLSKFDIIPISDKSRDMNPISTVGTYFVHSDHYNFTTNEARPRLSGFKAKTFGEFVQSQLELKRTEFIMRIAKRRLTKSNDSWVFNYRGHTIYLDYGKITVKYGRANSKNTPFKVDTRDINRHRQINGRGANICNSGCNIPVKILDFNKQYETLYLYED